MTFRAILYAYILGGLTFIPLLLAAAIAWTIYTSVPVGDPDPAKLARAELSREGNTGDAASPPLPDDQPRTRKGWLTVRRTFEEKEIDGSYVNFMRSFLDSRSKDPKRSRPKDMWYVVFKRNVLYLYEDENMTECEAAIYLSAHEVMIYPDGLQDGELFTKRNAICLKPLQPPPDKTMPSATKEMNLEDKDVDAEVERLDASEKKKRLEKEKLLEAEKLKNAAREEALDPSTPWFIFVRSCVEMEDWYHTLVHASSTSSDTPTLEPLLPVFQPADMLRLVSTLDEQPDVIPMRWLNALIGRLFYSFYRTDRLETFIIGRLMKKLSKVKVPSILQNITVTEVSVGNTPPTLSKPMLKELTKEGDAALEVRLTYKGEVRITVEATALISLGQRFKSYTVKLVLACVLREIDGNLLVKVKRPPSNRLWYSFTQPPTMVLDVEPVVSDRQIKWSMILGTIESRLKEVIYESVVMPNMDDIAFFESNMYQHRGGIWADAQRKAHDLSSPSLNPLEEAMVPDPTIGAPLHKSHSADEVAELQKEEPSPAVQIPRAETIAVPEASASMQEAGKKAPSNDGAKTADVKEKDESDTHERGRTTGADDRMAQRTSSVPPKTDTVSEMGQNPTQQFSYVVDSTTNGLPSPASVTPSVDGPTDQPSYSHSSSRSRSLSSTVDFMDSGSSTPTTSSSRPQSSHSTNTSSASSNAASSFLSALKAKDKQALSNTAKEAMRKWSANWSGFKRDSVGSNNSNSDDTADAGSLHHTSNSSSSSQSRRGNYADIRAAVAGRRDRVVSGEQLSVRNSTPPGETPIVRGEEGMGSPSRSASPTPPKESGASPALNPTVVLSQETSPMNSLSRRDSLKLAPSPPRPTTEVQNTEVTRNRSGDDERSSNTSSVAAPLVPSPSPSISSTPIYRQPSQGASMTIPGIHASHRGEVMSMGYAPPAPAVPPTTENKLKAPAIQNMYRLFKSPLLAGQQSQNPQLSPSLASRSPSEQNATSSSNSDVTPLSLSSQEAPTPSSEVQPSAKPVPPPLPPRSTPISTPVDSDQQKGQATPSSASEALKMIVTEDNRRQSQESTGGGRGTPSRRASLGAKRLSGINFEDFVASAAESHDTPNDVSPSPQSSTTTPPDDSALSEKRDTPTTNVPPPLPPRRSTALPS